MTLRVTVSGTDRLAKKLRRVQREVAHAVAQAVAQAVEESAEDLRAEARALLDRPGTTGPSAPGEPPRRQSGRLRDSLFVEVAPDGASASVGTDLAYGAHLEFGTQDMAARPWLFPAFERLNPRIRARLESAVREALRRAARR